MCNSALQGSYIQRQNVPLLHQHTRPTSPAELMKEFLAVEAVTFQLVVARMKEYIFATRRYDQVAVFGADGTRAAGDLVCGEGWDGDGKAGGVTVAVAGVGDFLGGF